MRVKTCFLVISADVTMHSMSVKEDVKSVDAAPQKGLSRILVLFLILMELQGMRQPKQGLNVAVNMIVKM